MRRYVLLVLVVALAVFAFAPATARQYCEGLLTFYSQNIKPLKPQ
jgi:hypothetical protein